MDIKSVLAQYDGMFGKASLEQIEEFLYGKICEAVDQIVQLEWQQFDKVKKEGGRVDCQDNFPTFSISIPLMRPILEGSLEPIAKRPLCSMADLLQNF